MYEEIKDVDPNAIFLGECVPLCNRCGRPAEDFNGLCRGCLEGDVTRGEIARETLANLPPAHKIPNADLEISAGPTDNRKGPDS